PREPRRRPARPRSRARRGRRQEARAATEATTSTGLMGLRTQLTGGLRGLVNGNGLRGLASGDGLKNLVTGRILKADLDDRDPDYLREQLPGLWLLASFYFRADVRGLERIPADGPVLLVGNHSGGNVTPDTMVFTLAFAAHFGVERRLHPLVHNH